jgi:archaellum component FlaC
MKLNWINHLPKDQQEGFKKQINSSRDVLERLQQILEDKRTEVVLSTDYDNPSWAYKQADRNGYDRALTEVINLVNMKET